MFRAGDNKLREDRRHTVLPSFFLGLKRPRLSSVLLAVSGLYVFSLGVKLGYEYFHYTVGFHGIYLQVIDFVPGIAIGGALLAYSLYRLSGWCLPRREN